MHSGSRRAPRRERTTDDYLGAVSRMLRAAGTRVATDDVEKLARLVAIHQVVDSAIVEAVRGLRAAGHTWQDIGDVTGTTRQAALMKWSKLV